MAGAGVIAHVLLETMAKFNSDLKIIKGVSIAIGNKFLKQEGLVSLRDVWIKVHFGGAAFR
jgi:hypothetical protein